MLSGLDAAKAINRIRGDAVVVSTMTPNRYWSTVSESPELDIPVFGAMGKASSVALGIAVARPDRRVMVLDGDGAVLMNLGTLVTIAGQAPANLVHFVFEDGSTTRPEASLSRVPGRSTLQGWPRAPDSLTASRSTTSRTWSANCPELRSWKAPYSCAKRCSTKSPHLH